MWRPPERLKHELPEVNWPTEAEAAESLLFSEVALGPRVAKQRSVVPAMVPWRATTEGLVTDELVAWYERFAMGRPGVIVVEATGVRDVPSGPLLRCDRDECVSGLRRIAQAIHRGSDGHTLALVQLIDFLRIRRRPRREDFLRRFLEIGDHHRRALAKYTEDETFETNSEQSIRDALFCLTGKDLDQILTQRELESLHYGYRERVTDTDLDHIRELPDQLPAAFANAAMRVRDAGFDGVELHCAHAYTLASFLSATNHRSDGYGGSAQNRIRLPIKVLKQVRSTIGANFVIGVRYLGDEVIDGGSTLEDAQYFGVEFAKHGAHYLSISKGGKFEDAAQPKVGTAAYPYTGRSGYECMPTVHSDARGPFSRNVPLAAAIRQAVHDSGFRVPIITAGGIGTFAQAEAILQNRHADLIAAARQSLADPDWLRKTRAGLGHTIRRCTYTNYCEALDQRHRQVTCRLWDRLDLDGPDVLLDPTGNRRLVAPTIRTS